ncbi:MAG: type VI-B CRISPR-associated RNA-guided ribonuclease Cas13b [Bacteroidales bacterium]|nr:type VI-B CRISPR-associated RNA-guided ribonuclease Cas13b [Bacteroidales bacterium]
MEGLDLTNETLQSCFATYLNMAQCNANIVLKDIINRLKLSDINKDVRFYYNDDGKIVRNDFDAGSCHKAVILTQDFLDPLTETNPEIVEKLKIKFLRAFPFLVPMLSMTDFYKFTKNDKLCYITNLSEDKNTDVHAVLTHETDLLKKNSIVNVAEKLRQVLNVLNFYRNNASHYCKLTSERLEEIEPDSNKVAIALDGVFIKALEVIKKRFKLYGKQKNGRNLQFIKDAKFSKIDFRKPNGIKEPNFKWSHCFYYRDNGYYTMSKMAVVFMSCLFIEKSFATQFFDQMQETFYQNIQKEEYKMWLREIYSCFHIRLPKKNINPYDNMMILGLDMLNEVIKCPNELFDCLRTEDQDIFRKKVDVLRNRGNLLGDFITEELKETFKNLDKAEDNSLIEIDNSDPNAETVLLKRATDRFPILAMKWIDKMKLFNSLRFQVIYGIYHDVFKNNETGEKVIKKCCDNQLRTRWISKNLTTFGRINEIEKFRNESWDGKSIIHKFEEKTSEKKDKVENNLDPWITDIYTQYVVEDGHIGIKDLDNNNVSIPNIIGKEFKEIKNESPDYWLSLYDLPAMVFHKYLNLDTENVIKQYKRNYNKFFDAVINNDINLSCDNFENIEDYKKNIEEKYKIKWKDIPTKIQDYLYPLEKRGTILSKRKTLVEYAKDIISNELEDTISRITALDDYSFESKIDEKNPKFKQFLPGNLAKFLVTDIVKFQKFTDKQDKPTGINFNVLQAKLATFSTENDYDNLVIIFNNLKMLKGESAEHPFIDKIISSEDAKPQNVVQFYSKYLHAKQTYLIDKKSKNIPKSNNLNSVIESIMTKANGLSSKMRKEVFSKDENLIFDLVNKGKKNDIFKKKDLVAKYATDLSYDFSDMYFLHPNKKKWMPNYDIKEVAESYKKTTTLPNGIFCKEIRKKLESTFPNIKSKLVGKEHVNITCLLECYIQEMDDAPQCFYKFPRTYPVFTKLDKVNCNNGQESEIIYRTKNEFHFKDESNKTIKLFDVELQKYIKNRNRDSDFDEITEIKDLKKLYNEYQIQESAINRISVQDFLLFIISKDIIVENLKSGKNDVNIAEYKLKDVNPNGKTGLLATVIDLPIQVSDFNKELKTINWHFVIRDYARIFTILNDHRLQKMLALVNLSEFNSEQIQDEFAEYDRNRIKAFETIIDFEKKVNSIEFIRNKMNEDIQINKYSNFKNLIDFIKEYLVSIKNISDLSIFDFDTLINLRNDFAHGDYPLNSYFEIISITSEDNKINLSTMMVDKIKMLVKNIIDNL